MIDHLTVYSKKVCAVKGIRTDIWRSLEICTKLWDCVRTSGEHRGREVYRRSSMHVKTRKHKSKMVWDYFEKTNVLNNQYVIKHWVSISVQRTISKLIQELVANFTVLYFNCLGQSDVVHKSIHMRSVMVFRLEPE